MPVKSNLAEHYLQRFVHSFTDEHRAQDLVTIDHLLPRALKRFLVELLEDQFELDQIEARTRREEAVEHETLLQRCQTINVFQFGMLHFDQFQLILLDPDEGEIGWSVSAN